MKHLTAVSPPTAAWEADFKPIESRDWQEGGPSNGMFSSRHLEDSRLKDQLQSRVLAVGILFANPVPALAALVFSA